MANPNWVAVNDKRLKSFVIQASASPSFDTLLGPVPTGEIWVVDAIWACNKTTTGKGAYVTLIKADLSSAALSTGRVINRGRAENVLDNRQLPLEEGDSIAVSASAESSMDFVASYLVGSVV